MILLTVPILWPIIAGLDFPVQGREELKLWFGVITLIVVEVGLITPPVELNVFVINSMAKRRTDDRNLQGRAAVPRLGRGPRCADHTFSR